MLSVCVEMERVCAETEEKCVWMGCGKKKVQGLAFCIDHLHATGDRR